MTVSCWLSFAHALESQTPGGDWVECSSQFPLCFTCTIQSPNLLENGNFEEYPGSGSNIITSDVIGWHTFGSYIQVLQNYPGVCTPQDEDGAKVVELDPVGPNLDIYQDIYTLPGRLYEVSVWHSWRDSPTPSVTKLEVWANDSLLISAQRSAGESCNWEQYNKTFSGLGLTRVLVLSPNGSGNYGPLVDAVKVYPADPQLQYQITYYLSTEADCSNCQAAFQGPASCAAASTTSPVSNCYGYVKNNQLVPTYCWTSASKYAN